ncbi:MAG: heparin lyase I family protein [Gilvibacter sp.]
MACKKDIKFEQIDLSDLPSQYQRTYLSFNGQSQELDYTNQLLKKAVLIDSFQIKILADYMLKLAPLGDKDFSDEQRELLTNTFDLSSTYGIKLDGEPLRTFKFSYFRVEDDRIVFVNNIKWLSHPVKKNIREKKGLLFKVSAESNDSGIVSVSTIGDTRIHFRGAQDLRKNLDIQFSNKLRFLGTSFDNSGYAFSGYEIFNHHQLVLAANNFEKSDYYVLFMGLLDYSDPIDEVKASLDKVLSIIKGKNAEAKIFLTTLPMLSKRAKNARARNTFYQSFNTYLRTLKNADVRVLDLANVLKDEQDHLVSNGVHMTQRGYSLFADLLANEFRKDPLLRPHYTGQVENFDQFPFTDQLIFSQESNTTLAGDFLLENSGENAFLNSQLFSTIKVKAPHRAEMSLQLEPYFENHEVWLGLKFNVPSDYAVDSMNVGRRSMILQLHSKPEEDETWDDYRKNLPFNRPSIALYLVSTKDGYRVDLFYGLNGKSETEFENLKWSKVGTSRIEPDAWNQIDLHFKVSHENDGYLEAWLNKKSLIDLDGKDKKVFGANMHNKALPFLKFGQYRYWADSHLHQVYFDDLKVKPNAEQYFFPEAIPIGISDNSSNLNR